MAPADARGTAFGILQRGARLGGLAASLLFGVDLDARVAAGGVPHRRRARARRDALLLYLTVSSHAKRILVTNDDGVHSEGIHALADALRRLGDVIVVAPHIEASAIGHALTLRRPLRMEQLRDGVYEVDGTPTDCVNIAITQLFATACRISSCPASTRATTSATT